MKEPDSSGVSSQIEEIFLEAIEQGDPVKSKIYIEKTCGHNPRLLETIQSMLNDFHKAAEFFDDAAQRLSVPDTVAASDELEPGTTIGVYTIVRLLGEGGSSKVYEAEQSAPVRRMVALKILKAGMDTASVLSRFEAERQTLAILEHPNISKVYDAGVTDSGRPYFVMELVQGPKITDYCEENGLSIDKRIQLMCQISSALQHAHNKGIIHRDIKPSNLLVSTVEGVPIPKLIDFGIAKATEQNPGEGRTIQGQPIGTPAYMSPEQFGCRNSDIDTRSDIYSLGVVLYELITGHPPFDNDELLQSGFEQMLHRICKVVPPRPSSLKNIRITYPRKELDWVLMKALEKEREQRYSTAHAFAADLESYLKKEPLKAHPPSRTYRLKKLLLRNKLATASIAFAALALAAGFTVSTLLYLRAHAAERVQTSLKEAAEERAHITRAAILIMEDRIDEADAEIRLTGGTLTQASVEATNVFRSLAIWNAKRGDWKTSADRWLAMAKVNRFDENDMTDKATRDLLPIAPTLVMTYDFERYGQFRSFLLERLGTTTYPFAAEHLLKLCLLTPAPPAVMNKLQHAATVAERAMPGDDLTPPSEWMEAWRCLALGLWYYRNGHYEKAQIWSNRSLMRRDWEEARIVQAMLVRAMANKHLGNTEQAVADIEIARVSVNEHLQQELDRMKDGHFHDWLNARILLNEAERTVMEAR